MKYREHLNGLVSGMLVTNSGYILASATKLIDVTWIQLIPLTLSVISLGLLLVHRIFNVYFENQTALANTFSFGLVSGGLAYGFILASIHMWLAIVVLFAALLATYEIRKDFGKAKPNYIKSRKNYYAKSRRT
ncbi:hypothetical protein BCU71_00915 [Vibrio lentus]|uniref:hypothetical protein n=1 Tax=Vibrio lentus TaxID=136468 RepID=UPI000C8587A1|nr:hypothetical protein [Vibrio lentus]PMH32145.1 hypothetical protein BCU71_00915 [Vibrio lentus]PMK71344.1 hypothetical protein BCT93_02740 [Vibrio lentus]